MRVKVYNVIEMAIEQGVSYGLQRYREYSEEPPLSDRSIENVEREVMNAIGDWFDFTTEAETPSTR